MMFEDTVEDAVLQMLFVRTFVGLSLGYFLDPRSSAYQSRGGASESVVPRMNVQSGDPPPVGLFFVSS